MSGQDEVLRDCESQPITTDEEGALAYLHGMKEIDNPYQPSTVEWGDWLRGFTQIRRQLGGVCRKGTCPD